jgi:hypothetical protein
MLPSTVAETIALADVTLRQDVAARIVRTFTRVNGVALTIVVAVFPADFVLLVRAKSRQGTASSPPAS